MYKGSFSLSFSARGRYTRELPLCCRLILKGLLGSYSNSGSGSGSGLGPSRHSAAGEGRRGPGKEGGRGWRKKAGTLRYHSVYSRALTRVDLEAEEVGACTVELEEVVCAICKLLVSLSHGLTEYCLVQVGDCIVSKDVIVDLH